MVLGADIIMPYLPTDYRWASSLEAAVEDTLVDAIKVKVGEDVNWFFDRDLNDVDYEMVPIFNVAVPVEYPVMWDMLDDGRVIDCLSEFEPHDDHKECVFQMGLVYNEDDFDYSFYDIPWGTPDSWIPDNPDDNGMCLSDFI